MPRVQPLEAPYPAEVQSTFYRIMSGDRPPLALFRTLAKFDRAWRKFRSGSLLDGELLSLRERELVINRACARSNCEYEWGVHVAVFADRAGLTEADVGGTLTYPLSVERWSAREAALLLAVDAVHDRATLSDDEFTALARFYAEEQIVEILMLAGFYRTVAYLANGLSLPLEPSTPRFADFADERERMTSTQSEANR